MAWVGTDRSTLAGKNSSSQAPSREGRRADSDQRERSDVRLTLPARPENVVRDTYCGEPGEIDVVVRPTGGALELIVADRGRGPGTTPDAAGPGLGLPLIAALADTLEVERSPSAGSRLIMSFLRNRRAPAVGFA